MTDTKDLIREIQEHTAAHGGENTATHLLVQAVMALQRQADELAAIGAGGVEPLRKINQPEPTVPDQTQDWAGMDGATAYLLIQRHADNWADAAKMMGEWLDANQRQSFDAADMAAAAAQGFMDGVASLTAQAADRAIEGCPELNMGNYDEVDVERLNDWAIRANDEIDRLHALAAGQATAAQPDSVQEDAARYRWLRDTSNADDPSYMIALHIRDEQPDLITIRKPTTRAEMMWLLKLAHLVISDVNKTLDDAFAPAQPVAEPAKSAPQHSPTPHGQVPAAQGDALSDAVRVPLNSLHADAAYLIGRLRDGSMPYARVIEIIRERIDAASPTAQAAGNVPAISDLPPLPDPDLRDVGTKPQDVKDFLNGYATEYARLALAARAPADSVTAPGGGVVAAGRFMDEAAERRSAQEGYEKRIKRVSERNPRDEGMYSLGWWDRAWKASAPTPPAEALDAARKQGEKQ